MSIKDARKRLVLDNQFGAGANTWAPATWFVGSSTTTSNADGTGFTEPAVGAYARVSVTNNATNFPAASTTAGKTTKRNGTDITFPNPTADWGLQREYGLFTASTGGTPEYTNAYDNLITVFNGATPVRIAANQMVIEVKP